VSVRLLVVRVFVCFVYYAFSCDNLTRNSAGICSLTSSAICDMSVSVHSHFELCVVVLLRTLLNHFHHKNNIDVW
jgi:hypothetical protein